MLRHFLTFSVFIFTFFASQETQPPTKSVPPPPAPYVIPVDAIRQANPVKPTAESLAQGKKWYGYDCAMCHGKEGDGKGEVATDMKVKTSDFTALTTLKERTDGELFYIIKNGKGQMPPEGNRLKPAELWNLVNYVRSFAPAKTPAETKAPH